MLRFLLVILGLIALAFGGLVLLLENPDKFKTQITDTITANSDYVVAIEGDLSWRYWPPLAIEVSSLQLANKAGNAPFVTLEAVAIDVDLMPILKGANTLDVKELAVTGGSITLITDERGDTNWEVIESATTTTTSPAADSAPQVAPSIHAIELNNITVTYANEDTGDRYSVFLEHLTTTSLTEGEPFQISFKANVDGGDQRTAAIEGNGQLAYKPAQNGLQFTDLMLTQHLTVGENHYTDIRANLSGTWNGDLLRLKQLDVNAGSIALSAKGALNFATGGIDADLAVSGADLEAFSKWTNIELPISALNATGSVQVVENRLALNALEGSFDNTKFRGSGVIQLSDPLKLNSEVRLDRFDTNLYLATPVPGEAATVTPEAAPTEQDPQIIPVDLLESVQLNSIFRIDELIVSEYTFSNSKIEIDSNETTLTVMTNSSGLGGKIVASLDSQWARIPMSVMTISLDDIDIAQATAVEGVTGKLSGHSHLDFSGTTRNDWASSITGKSVFSVKDGSLDVRPIKRMAKTIDNLRGKQSSISTWPDIMPFNHLGGEHIFDQGLEQGQVLTAKVENLDLAALGGININNETLRYDVSAMFNKAGEGQFEVGDQLTGIRWPMTCEGKFTDTPADLCFGQENAISNLVTEIIEQDLKRRGNEKLEELLDDKIPDEYKEITRELFKGLFKG
jgi:AsmA protein